MTFAAPTACYLNGVDPATFGLVVDEVGGVFDAVSRTDALLEFPQGVGARLGTLPGRIATRTVSLGATLPAATATDLETAKDRVKALCGDGLVEIRLVTRDVVLRGRLAEISFAHVGPQLRTYRPAARATLRFVCPDPFAYDRTPQLTAIGTTATALSLGTAPSVGRDTWSAIITIVGAGSAPTLTETDAAGNTLRQMVFTWSPTTSDAIEVDVGRGLVSRITSGVRSNGMADVTAGFEFPRLDPADGDYTAGAFPGLSVSVGSALARYYRAWR